MQTIACRSGFDIPVRSVGDAAGGLAVLLPGLRYGNDRSLMQLAATAAQAKGYGLLCLDYRYDLDADFLNASDAVIAERLVTDAHDIAGFLQTAAQAVPVALIGKSLGTVLMGAMLAVLSVPTRRLVWLTPALRGTPLLPQMLAATTPSLVAIGTADHHYEDAAIAALRGHGMTVLTPPGVDHGYEVERDLTATACAHAEVRDALIQFL